MGSSLVPLGPTFGICGFPEGVEKLIKNQKSTICSVEIDKNFSLHPKLTFDINSKGEWISKPIEDMSPLLDREDIRSEMIIDMVTNK